MDFFAVPTVRFQILYVFLVLARERRRIGHFALTAHPTAEWTVQQLREAFPWDAAPRYLLRDRDRIFGADFVDQVKAMGIQQVLSAPRSPWQRGLLVLLSLKRAQPNDILVCLLCAPTEYLPQLVFTIGTDAPKPVQRRVALPDQVPHQFAHRTVQQRVGLCLNSTKNQQLRPASAKRTASGVKGRWFESTRATKV